VLSRFAADFRQPAADEGYQKILYLKPSDHPSSVYSRSDIAMILRRVQDSPAVDGDQKYSKSGFSGYSFSGNTNKGGGWVKPLHQYPWVPRGRGTNVNAGPSRYFRHWQSASYRGNSLGSHSGGGILSRNSGILQTQDNSSQVPSQGNDSIQDSFVID